MTLKGQSFPRAIHVLTAATAILYVAVALLGHRSFALTVFGDTAQLFLAALVTAAFGYHALGGRGHTRFFWTLMSAGAGCWLVSQGIWTYYEVVLRVSFNDSSIQDVILFLRLVPMMAALAIMPHGARKTSVSAPYSLGMLAVWWMFLYAYIVVPWQYVYPHPERYGYSFNFLYSIEDLAFIAALALLTWKAAGAWRTFYGRMLLGSVGYTISAQLTNSAIDARSYYTGSYYDIPLVVSIACICWAAAGAKTAAEQEETENLELESSVARWITRLSFLALVSVPLMAAWSLSFSRAPLVVRNFRVSVSLIAMVALSAMLFALQWLLSDRLHASLRTVNDSLGELAVAREALQHQATHDAMTGCLNRGAIGDALARELLRASRSDLPLAVFLIDLDHFKQINDRLGHHAGDIAIVAACTRMQDCVRAHDYMGRYGGEEFLAVIPDADEATAVQIAERMRSRISQNPVIFNGNPILLTATIGVALSKLGDTPETLLRRADLAMYDGKRLGRNLVQVAKLDVCAG